MPSILDEIAYLRSKAMQLRRLSAEHGAAGNDRIAAKLAEIADELEEKAMLLERPSQPLAG